MQTKTEIRTVATALRSTSEFKLEGVANTYGALSLDLGGFRERIAPGAFSRSIASGQDVCCLFNHDKSRVLGRTKNGTLTLQDDPDALRFVCQLNPKSQEHRDLHAAVERHDIDQCSFAFSIADENGEQWDEAQDERGQRFSRRTVRSANLFDVSCVTTPAYGGSSTSVSARQFRSCDYNAAPAFVRQILQTPTLTAVDVENRKRLQSLSRTIYSDKSFQAHIENVLLQQRAKNIAEIIERDDRKEILEALREELDA